MPRQDQVVTKAVEEIYYAIYARPGVMTNKPSAVIYRILLVVIILLGLTC